MKYYLYFLKTLVLFLCLTACAGDEGSDTNTALPAPAADTIAQTDTAIDEAQQAVYQTPVAVDSIGTKRPPSNFKPNVVSKINIKTEVSDSFSGGDFAQYAFSPNGTQIVYAKQVKEVIDVSEIGLTDVNSKNRRILVAASQTRKYAAFGAYVTSLKWLNANTIQAKISDGDAGSTTIEIDVKTGKITKEKFAEADAEHVLSENEEQVIDQLLKTFPSTNRHTLNSAFHNAHYILNNNEIVLQYNHIDKDYYVHYYNIAQKKHFQIIKLPRKTNYLNALKDVQIVGTDLLFLITDRSNFYLFRHRKSTELVELLYRDSSSTSNPGVKVLYNDNDKLIFMIKRQASFKPGDNPLFLYKNGKLTEIKGFENMHDAEISADGKTLAFSKWQNNQRNLYIHKIYLPNL